ncbi:MAG: hypothetical protein OER86_14155, partial [Phycisphaerae bacterium]|nr:hypothetical protein [Phycisphaerae bacterium]
MLSSEQVLDDYYPQVRAWLIQIGAVLDRYDRAGGGLDADQRLRRYHQSLQILASADGDRAEQIQRLFS